jgi:hypothetical protein
MGGLGEHGSGDLMVAFATSNTGLPSQHIHIRHEPLGNIAMLRNSGVSRVTHVLPLDRVGDAFEIAIDPARAG